MHLFLILCESAFVTKNHASWQLISDKIQIIRFYLSLVQRGQIICLYFIILKLFTNFQNI